MRLSEIEDLLEKVKFQDWEFYLGTRGMELYLQVKFDAPCTVEGGQPQKQHGRKWFISEHMTKSEIVQTAFKAVITALEHEAREMFTYRDRPVFGPHFDVDALHGICQHFLLDKREEMAA